ncbi:MAG TPA: hypothetical protein VNI01_16705 [Elusimicrobiota bacterium]|jgi:hypothetical protein|nr:hypothetical protein [Elusimicrobiota bacterium]
MRRSASQGDLRQARAELRVERAQGPYELVVYNPATGNFAFDDVILSFEKEGEALELAQRLPAPPGLEWRVFEHPRPHWRSSVFAARIVWLDPRQLPPRELMAERGGFELLVGPQIRAAEKKGAAQGTGAGTVYRVHPSEVKLLLPHFRRPDTEAIYVSDIASALESISDRPDLGPGQWWYLVSADATLHRPIPRDLQSVQ